MLSKLPRTIRGFLKKHRKAAPHRCFALRSTFMAMLFRVRRKGSPARWIVLVEGQLYGEYTDKGQALLDAIEAATGAREAGQEAEV